MKHFNEYKPDEHGKSDFYSWNLYRWLRKQEKEPLAWQKKRIYKAEDGVLFIGARYSNVHDDVSGFRLTHLCSGGSSDRFPEVGLWVGSGKWEDVTDWFYSEYERIGVCAIHGDFAHNWKYTVAKTIRVCRNCKKREFKKVEMVEKTTWVDA